MDALRAEVEQIPWFHHIDLGNGIITPGRDMDSLAKIRFHQIPEDLTGKSVLDIGAWDGLFSFEAEKRGARRVLATDAFIWEDKAWGSKRGFELARRALQSKVEDLTIDVMDLSPERVGTFDVVLFLGVLYHLRHPLYALERVASVCDEMVILGTQIDMLSHDRPAAAFYPTDELNGDSTNWWGPNVACVRAMLNDVGFKRVDVVGVQVGDTSKPIVQHSGAFHAWK
jgi:tRNA (mo5U34)-methyltransferase